VRPRIAIPQPTSDQAEYNRLNQTAYVDAINLSGGDAVEVRLDLDLREVAALASTCDGVLLPGSPADLDPGLYGQAREEATASPDASRERVDRILLDQAFKTGKPVLGICFGQQMLNVFCGGTLVQDLTVMPVNHTAGRGVIVAHSAAIAIGSLLAGIVDRHEAPIVDGMQRLPINSSHHQAVGIPGRGLRVTARCPQDGVVEAIEQEHGGFVVGVQWHPERTLAQSASSRKLFAEFISKADEWASGTLGQPAEVTRG
jgi:putative glutamine amidotransferase